MCFSSFFFFQAEDGIRDPLVTGVQTCALPILYVDEFNSRYVTAEDDPPIRSPRTVRRHRGRRVQTNVLIAALVGIALVTALVIAAWKSGSPSSQNVVGAGPAQNSTAHHVKRPHGPASITLRGVRSG